MNNPRVLRRSIAALGLLTALVALPATVAPVSEAAAAANPRTCPSGSDPSRWHPDYIVTPRQPVTIWNRTIELRYHTSTRCAWGRISNGNPGDSVWVDWSDSAGTRWDQLGVTRIPSRGTQVYTPAHNDAGYWMRACGKAGDRPEVVCTGWY